MFFKKRNIFLKLFIVAGLFVSAGIFVLSGCASAPKTLDSSITSPQVIVNPESVSLGVASLLGEKIVFEGAGFEPEDSVFITLFGPNETEAIVADGKVGSDGKFTAAVGTLAKVTGILRGTVSGKYAKDGSYKQSVVLTQPSIPAGTYAVKATSMLSDKTAETKLILTNPSVGNRLKDWLGKRLGKIQDKRS